MKYTNNHGLPEVFMRAVLNDAYDNEGSDFTPSSLSMTTSRAWALMRLKPDEVTEDVANRVDSFIGQAIHKSAERAARPGDLCEKRMSMGVDYKGKTYKVSAQIDLFEVDSGALYDWKSSKAYGVSKKAGSGKKPEYEAQLNIQAELLRRAGHKVTSLHNIYVVKDWSDQKAGQADHPLIPVVIVDYPLWSSEKVFEYILGKMASHLSALDSLPKCTAAETWGGRRCARWCSAASVCQQYQEACKTGLIDG